MGDTPFGSSARLSGDLERSFERERERLEGILSSQLAVVEWLSLIKKGVLMVIDGTPSRSAFAITTFAALSVFRTPFR
jgi:hypothetical protein